MRELQRLVQLQHEAFFSLAASTSPVNQTGSACLNYSNQQQPPPSLLTSSCVSQAFRGVQRPPARTSPTSRCRRKGGKRQRRQQTLHQHRVRS
eukprot:355736-Chlamydomonas_euryale.AAC.3